MKKLNLPILFLCYKNIDITLNTFNLIKKANPIKLYIHIDGPKNKIEEEEQNKLRKFFSENMFTDIIIYSSKKNLGLKNGVLSGINWFFKFEDMGIIIEYDTLVNLSFFKFAEKLLDKYKNNKKIYHISASNFYPNMKMLDKDSSYGYNSWPHVWGWATWKRAWNDYQKNLIDFKEFKKNKKIKNFFYSKKAQKYFLKKLENTNNGSDGSWDWAWAYTILYNNGYSIYPKTNLVSNVGFQQGASTSSNLNHILSKRKTYFLDEIVYTSSIKRNIEIDNLLAEDLYNFENKINLKIILFNLFLLIKKNKFIKLFFKKK